MPLRARLAEIHGSALEHLRTDNYLWNTRRPPLESPESGSLKAAFLSRLGASLCSELAAAGLLVICEKNGLFAAVRASR